MKIAFMAGHGLFTKGKQDPEGMKEWSYTSPIVAEAMKLLAQYEGVQTKRFDDPTGKVDVELKDRTDAINAWKADVVFDVHLNAFGPGGWNDVSGTETYVYKTKPKEAMTLAAQVQNNLLRELGLRNRGVKAADFHTLRETNMTAVLPEIAFMTNKGDSAKMRKPEYQKKAAKAIVDAIVFVYKLKLKPKPVAVAPKPTQKAPAGKLFKVQAGAFSERQNAEDMVVKLKKAGFDATIILD